MSEFKGTPGEWEACVDVNRHGRKRHGDTDEVTTTDGRKICRMTGDTKHSYHDARLIAAAPKLLAACEGMAGRLEEYVAELRADGLGAEANNIDRIAHSLRVAAAKAKGQTA